MEKTIAAAYERAPKTWIMKLLLAFAAACLLAWSSSTVVISDTAGNGLSVAGNILSGILHPDTVLLFNFTTSGVAYLLLETLCIAFLGTIVGAVISVPLSFLSATNLMPKPIALLGRFAIAAIRTIPAFIYGLMFIRVTGPGPFAGLLTMSLCSIGMVSKMFIESIEDLDKRILESLDPAVSGLHVHVNLPLRYESAGRHGPGTGGRGRHRRAADLRHELLPLERGWFHSPWVDRAGFDH